MHQRKLTVTQPKLTVNVNVYPTELLEQWEKSNEEKPVVYARLQSQDQMQAFEGLVSALGITKAEFISNAVAQALARVKRRFN